MRVNDQETNSLKFVGASLEGNEDLVLVTSGVGPTGSTGATGAAGATGATGGQPAYKATFAETAGAGVYTATIPVPNGTIVTQVGIRSSASWAADTADLDVGYTSDDNAFQGALNVKTAPINENSFSAANPVVIPDGDDLLATLTTTGAGGTTGDCDVYFVCAEPAETAAVKA